MGYNFIDYRASYRMIDLYGYYVYQFCKRHFLKPGFGISYTWGVDHYAYLIEPLTDYVGGEFWEENASYPGILPQVSYDYVFFHNRLNAGTDFRMRKYMGMKMVQFDFGVHLGVNF